METSGISQSGRQSSINEIIRNTDQVSLLVVYPISCSRNTVYLSHIGFIAFSAIDGFLNLHNMRAKFTQRCIVQ